MNDPELEKSIENIKSGDKTAFSYIIDKYQTLAFNIALPIVGNVEDAEEVVQDSFIRVFKYIRQYNGESRFSSWLYKIVYNRALSKVQTNAKQWSKTKSLKDQFVAKANNYEEKMDFLDNEIRNNLLAKALGLIPESDRLIITLFYFGEKSIQEIAEITSWKVSKCKVKLMRARQKLEVLLKHTKEDIS